MNIMLSLLIILSFLTGFLLVRHQPAAIKIKTKEKQRHTRGA